MITPIPPAVPKEVKDAIEALTTAFKNLESVGIVVEFSPDQKARNSTILMDLKYGGHTCNRFGVQFKDGVTRHTL